MAKVFLDANYFIGLANRIPEAKESVINNQECHISILSCHILFYINKIKVPDEKTDSFIEDFNLVVFTKEILQRALTGPTDDLEDNIQLHSAIEAKCNYFLTFDKKLLKMKFFGKTRISDRIL